MPDNTDIQIDVTGSVGITDLQKRVDLLTRSLGKQMLETQSLSKANAKAQAQLATLEGAYKQLSLQQKNSASEINSLNRLYGAQQAQIKSLTSTVNGYKGKLAQMSSEKVKVTKETEKLTKSSRYLDGALRGVAGGVGKLWLAYGSLVPMLAGFSMAALSKEVNQLGAAFEYTTQYASALSDKSVGLSTIRKELLAIKGVAKTPTELSDGFLELVKAGVGAKEALIDIKTAAKFATVGEMSLKSATEQLVTITKAFEISSKGAAGGMLTVADTADTVAFAAQKSTASFTDMQTAFTYMAPLASLFNMSIKDASAALMVMHDAGLKGSLGATALRTAFTRLLTAGDSIQEKFIELGGSFSDLYDEVGNPRKFNDVAEALKRVKDSSDPEFWARFSKDAFGLRGMAINVAIDNLAKLKTNFNSLSDAAGFVDKTFSEVANSTKITAEELNANFQKALIEAFDGEKATGVLRDINDLVTSEDFKTAIADMADGVYSLGKAAIAVTPILSLLNVPIRGFADLADQFAGALDMIFHPVDTYNNLADPLAKFLYELVPGLEKADTELYTSFLKLIGVIKEGSTEVTSVLTPVADEILTQKAKVQEAASGKQVTIWEALGVENPYKYSGIEAPIFDPKTISKIITPLEDFYSGIDESLIASSKLDVQVRDKQFTERRNLIEEAVNYQKSQELSLYEYTSWLIEKELKNKAAAAGVSYETDSNIATLRKQLWSKYYDDEYSLEEESIRAKEAALMAAADKDIANYTNNIEEKKKLNDQLLQSSISLYSQLSEYDSSYTSKYNALKEQEFDKQLQNYIDIGATAKEVNDLILLHEKETSRKNLLASGDFFDGVKLGYEDLLKDQKTWADHGLEITKTFAEGAKDALADNFIDIAKGEFDDLEDAWSSLWDSMLAKMMDSLADMVVDEAFTGISNIFSSSSSSSGGSSNSWIGPVIDTAADWFENSNWFGATGGYISSHPGGGLITAGSGIYDDVYLGSSNGVAGFGMGGEFIVNKKATAKYLPLLQTLNAKGYANGGLTGSVIPSQYTAVDIVTIFEELAAAMNGAGMSAGNLATLASTETTPALDVATTSFHGVGLSLAETEEQSISLGGILSGLVSAIENTAINMAVTTTEVATLSSILGPFGSLLGTISSKATLASSSVKSLKETLSSINDSIFGVESTSSSISVDDPFGLNEAFGPQGYVSDTFGSLDGIFGNLDSVTSKLDNATKDQLANIMAQDELNVDELATIEEALKSYQELQIAAESLVEAGKQWGTAYDSYAGGWFGGNESTGGGLDSSGGGVSESEPGKDRYASGGWLGRNPSGGYINQGSGLYDDVFLGMSGNTANFGMGGEFVVNKKAAAKFGPWLEKINSKYYADGGYISPSLYSISTGSLSSMYNDSLAMDFESYQKEAIDAIRSAAIVVAMDTLTDFQQKIYDINEEYKTQIEYLNKVGASVEDIAIVEQAKAIELRQLADDIIEPFQYIVDTGTLSDYAKQTYDLNEAYTEAINNLIDLGSSLEDIAIVEQAKYIEIRNSIDDLLSESLYTNLTYTMTDYEKSLYDLGKKYEDLKQAAIDLGANEQDLMVIEQARLYDLRSLYKTQLQGIVDDARSAMTSAGDDLVAAVERQADDINSRYDGIVDGFNSSIAEAESTIDSLTSSVKLLRDTAIDIADMSFAVAQADLLRRVAERDLTGDLSGTVSAATKFNTSLYATGVDYKRAVGRTGNLLEDLAKIGDEQITEAKTTIDYLKDQIALTERLRAEELAANNSIISGLGLVSESVLSVSSALAAYISAQDNVINAMSDLAVASGGEAGYTAGPPETPALPETGFDTVAYSYNKAKQLVNEGYYSDTTTAYYAYKSAIADLGLSDYEHYVLYGKSEGVNPYYGFATGGSFLVDGTSGTDNLTLPGLRVSAGEMVHVSKEDSFKILSDAINNNNSDESDSILQQILAVLTETKERSDAQMTAIAVSSYNTAKQLTRWDGDGMPDTRSLT